MDYFDTAWRWAVNVALWPLVVFCLCFGRAERRWMLDDLREDVGLVRQWLFWS